jgi:hypothetical protein
MAMEMNIRSVSITCVNVGLILTINWIQLIKSAIIFSVNLMAIVKIMIKTEFVERNVFALQILLKNMIPKNALE